MRSLHEFQAKHIHLKLVSFGDYHMLCAVLQSSYQPAKHKLSLSSTPVVSGHAKLNDHCVVNVFAPLHYCHFWEPHRVTRLTALRSPVLIASSAHRDHRPVSISSPRVSVLTSTPLLSPPCPVVPLLPSADTYRRDGPCLRGGH